MVVSEAHAEDADQREEVPCVDVSAGNSVEEHDDLARQAFSDRRDESS